MSEQPFHLTDTPSDLSVSLLVRSLSDDSIKKAVSAKNYAHRSRVIRQQTKLLALQLAKEAGALLNADAKHDELRLLSENPDGQHTRPSALEPVSDETMPLELDSRGNERVRADTSIGRGYRNSKPRVAIAAAKRSVRQ